MSEYKDYKDDLALVSEKFEKDGLHVPQSLSEEAVRGMLEPSPAGQPRRRWVRPLIAAAACLALIAGLFPLLQGTLPGQLTLTAGEDGLYHFRSYRELDREMKELTARDEPLLTTGDVVMEDSDMALSNSAGPDGSAELGSESALAAAPKDSSAEASASSRHSSTYTQVEGIDEADLVKTDGRYIYYLSSSTNDVIIAKASNGKASRVSAIRGGDTGSYIYDMYVKDDLLILIGQDRQLEETGFMKSSASEVTAVTVYDISDRRSPVRKTRYSQTGAMLSSRLIGGSLCLVTNDMRYGYTRGRNVPFLRYDSAQAEKLSIDCISCFPQVNVPSFTVVSQLDLFAEKFTSSAVRTKAVLGGSDQIFCSGDDLYVTGTIMPEPDFAEPDFAEPDFTEPEFSTQVVKISLARGKVTYKASAIVDGMVNNQFSMDDSGGIFKIATTSSDRGQDVNNLFTFDENLRQLGSVIGFARNEHIEAVRYIKDKAYVITYEQTDPLFIIDLNDPARPVIEGQVKISGFSTLLVPSGQDQLLGLGFSTDSSWGGEATDGLKLALFDISDPSHPAVADSLEVPGMYSPVQYDHRALLVGPDASYYAIPYEQEPASWRLEDDAEVIIEEETPQADEGDSAEEVEDEMTYGVRVFSVKDGRISQGTDRKTRDAVSRCVYIGDYIYAICEDDRIEGFAAD